MRADSYKVFKYGERFKIVYYKRNSRDEKRKKRFDVLADLYENFCDYIPDDDLYERSYSAYLAKQKLLQARENMNSTCELSALEKEARLSQSVSRSKGRVFELAMCNDFDYFCTFTLSAEKRDRFDLRVFSKDFGQFIRNLNRSRSEHSKVKYLIIPERHRDGAWHAHGLLKGLSACDLVKNKNGYFDWQPYSNRFGFISLSVIRDASACSSYITKYITKEFAEANREAFGHLYFASHGLKGREVFAFGDADSNTFPREFDFENDFVKIAWFDDVESVENFFA